MATHTGLQVDTHVESEGFDAIVQEARSVVAHMDEVKQRFDSVSHRIEQLDGRLETKRVFERLQDFNGVLDDLGGCLHDHQFGQYGRHRAGDGCAGRCSRDRFGNLLRNESHGLVNQALELFLNLALDFMGRMATNVVQQRFHFMLECGSDRIAYTAQVADCMGQT